MKRLFSLLMVAVVVLGMAGCGQTASEEVDALQEPLTYTELPTALTASKVGQVNCEVVTASGGLYYSEGGLYGVMSFDGSKDTGAIYSLCQPKGDYFIVTKGGEANINDVTTANTVGLVDASGREIVPCRYASVDLLGKRFVRVAELTGTTENADEKLTQITDEGKTVMCTGIWYIYDLQTGKQVPKATGTKPYISFDCGGYVKFVPDDKKAITCTADGTLLPDDLIHLKNGHYAVKSENKVYDSEGNFKFAYDPNGYIPEDSTNVTDYIVAKKTVSGKDVYVLLDMEGKVVTAELPHRPDVYGELLYIAGQLMTFDGKPVVEGTFKGLYWEPVYGQCWTLYDGTTYKAVDKTGKTLYETTAENSQMDTALMLCYTQNESKRSHYSVKDNDYTIEGVGVAPFIVKRPSGESFYELVNVLTGEVILSGALDYKAATKGSLVYVYAKNAENSADVYVLR